MGTNYNESLFDSGKSVTARDKDPVALEWLRSLKASAQAEDESKMKMTSPMDNSCMETRRVVKCWNQQEV
uniref:SCP domain-containing protein n=1 Tax=Angiostrongylus cantonensis TaxID=6313 RepID=A0A0K0DP48_ANGCA